MSFSDVRMEEIDPELPLMVFDMKEGKADLVLHGKKEEIWLPLMFAHHDLKQWGVMEPGIKREMIIIEVNEKMKEFSIPSF